MTFTLGLLGFQNVFCPLESVGTNNVPSTMKHFLLFEQRQQKEEKREAVQCTQKIIALISDTSVTVLYYLCELKEVT